MKKYLKQSKDQNDRNKPTQYCLAVSNLQPKGSEMAAASGQSKPIPKAQWKMAYLPTKLGSFVGEM